MTGHLPADTRTVAIVGNAPETGDHADEIDACDVVVRINNAPGFGGRTGRRLTHLALVNRGGQPREWLETGLGALPALGSAPDVILPFPPLHGAPKEVCWTRQMVEALAPLGIRARVLGQELHENAWAELRDCGAPGRPNPSTGFLLAYHFTTHRARPLQVHVFGFGFAGWDGHPWGAERAWMRCAHAQGRLRLVPVER